MEVFMVYLWLKLDSVVSVFAVTTVISGIAAVVLGIIYLNLYNEEEKESVMRLLKKDMIIVFFGVCVCTFLPTTRQAAILIGTHYAVELKNSPEGQKVMTLIRKKANEYLDDELKGVRTQ
jgi:ammonia channel protein AmtB